MRRRDHREERNGLRWLLHTTVVALVLAPALVPQSAQAAPFVNLNFEQAMVPSGTPPGVLPASLAFPGWTPRIGDTILSTVYYNFDGIGEPAIGLYDEPRTTFGFPVFESTYSATLIGPTDGATVVSLSQVGDVPHNSRSIRLLGASFFDPPGISLGGMILPVIRLSGGPPSDVAVYGADVTAFAGLTIELRISNAIVPNINIQAVDAISFSPIPIPEPSQIASLLALVLASVSIRVARSRTSRGASNNQGGDAHEPGNNSLQVP